MTRAMRSARPSRGAAATGAARRAALLPLCLGLGLAATAALASAARANPADKSCAELRANRAVLAATIAQRDGRRQRLLKVAKILDKMSSILEHAAVFGGESGSVITDAAKKMKSAPLNVASHILLKQSDRFFDVESNIVRKNAVKWASGDYGKLTKLTELGSKLSNVADALKAVSTAMAAEDDPVKILKALSATMKVMKTLGSMTGVSEAHPVILAVAEYVAAVDRVANDLLAIQKIRDHQRALLKRLGLPAVYTVGKTRAQETAEMRARLAALDKLIADKHCGDDKKTDTADNGPTQGCTPDFFEAEDARVCELRCKREIAAMDDAQAAYHSALIAWETDREHYKAYAASQDRYRASKKAAAACLEKCHRAARKAGLTVHVRNAAGAALTPGAQVNPGEVLTVTFKTCRRWNGPYTRATVHPWAGLVGPSHGDPNRSAVYDQARVGKAPDGGVQRSGTLRLTVPKVKRKTHIEFRFVADSRDDAAVLARLPLIVDVNLSGLWRLNGGRTFRFRQNGNSVKGYGVGRREATFVLTLRPDGRRLSGKVRVGYPASFTRRCHVRENVSPISLTLSDDTNTLAGYFVATTRSGQTCKVNSRHRQHATLTRVRKK